MYIYIYIHMNTGDLRTALPAYPRSPCTTPVSGLGFERPVERAVGKQESGGRGSKGGQELTGKETGKRREGERKRLRDGEREEGREEGKKGGRKGELGGGKEGGAGGRAAGATAHGTDCRPGSTADVLADLIRSAPVHSVCAQVHACRQVRASRSLRDNGTMQDNRSAVVLRDNTARHRANAGVHKGPTVQTSQPTRTRQRSAVHLPPARAHGRDNGHHQADSGTRSSTDRAAYRIYSTWRRTGRPRAPQPVRTRAVHAVSGAALRSRETYPGRCGAGRVRGTRHP